MSRRVISTILIAWLVGSLPRPVAAQGPVPPAHEAHAGAATIRYGVEFWVRASRTLNFDFDDTDDDTDDFGWNRLKPLVSVQTAHVELTLQGQDSRSYGVAELNPNGTSTYASRTSELDFVKAFVKLTPRPELGHRSTDRVRGDGTTHLFDTLYSSGFNNDGYLGLSQGRNIGDLRVGGASKLAAPLTLTWAVHDQRLSTSRDQWYAIFTPNVSRPDAPSGHLGRELDATLLVRPRWARGSAIALGHMAYFPGRYLSTGPHARALQFAIDVWGQF